MVWGSEVVNQYDKAVLISEWLNTQTGESDDEVTPLQSVAELGWNTMVIYNDPEKGNAWSRSSLIALREFEKNV